MPAAKPGKTVKAGGKDIRMFFGGKASGGSQKPVAIPASSLTSQKKPAIEISDSVNEAPGSPKKKPSPSKPALKPGNVIQVDSDEEPIVHRSKPVPKPTTVAEEDSDDEPIAPKKSTSSRRKISALISSDEEEDASPPKKKAALTSSKDKPKPRASTSKIKQKQKKVEDDDYDMESPLDSPASEDDNYEEEDEDVKPARARNTKPPPNKITKAAERKTPVKKAASPSKVAGPSKEPVEEEEEPKKKFNWAASKAAKLAGPVAHGSKEVPDGAPDALVGLAFVFTGELSSFSRDEAIELAKRFGGRVVGQPSSKTNFVVLGDNAGPSKLAALKKHGIKTLSEDEFLNLIGTRKGLGKLDEKTKKKMEKEEEDIKKQAKEMEKTEKAHAVGGKGVDPKTQLWTARYAPQSLKEVCGNKGQVDKLQQWLHDWPMSLKSGFKKPGKNGMNVYRAVLITGSPGIGKTTSAHLCAKLEGFTPIELNASDARSKKLVESGMNINNTSLDGYIHGSSVTNAVGVPITDRTCLIMDEVDGMSAGDRGGVGALNALIKKSKIPIICIANDRGAQKLKPLVATTFNLTFQKPQVNMIRSRILSIAFKEKMKIPANVIDQLITGAQSDIRQVLNMLSTWKLSNDSMDFDEGKSLVKMNEKYAIMTPFDITSKMLGPYLFSATARETLGDKMEYYFQDHSFMPLFIQENYLKTQPARVRNLEGPEKVLKELELMDKAASSISDGDLVDSLIHGPEQHWGLMPLHAVCSTIRPAAALYGMGAHYGGPGAMSFPQWLGQNSKQNKLSRQLGDVQIRMRLKVSGDKAEIRQSYIPALFPHIVKPLTESGASAIEEVIETMDQYYLSKEDWDTIVELGVDDHKDELVLKKVPGATKAAFTRKYNASEHPIPFHKAQDLGKLPKKLAGGPAPDLEEAFVDDIVDDISDDDNKGKDPDDIANDSLIQASKKKAAPAKKKAKK
ncbi:replication factor RFC1 C terminal domain-containing protein [Crucibulum laeve]|uniref:Replication factor C subunit 1 n=1 Tax=Crucibulum laeve TaxID=68775 RepID=A0A5C3LPS7_9AGAR|nr:replication factor RFC1 C terminal domain-containing protein [Crucibulum laeve]